METKRRGRPPNPLDPDASHAARLGAEIRAHRQARGLTLEALASLIDFSPQRISDIERAKAWPSEPFVAACDSTLEARGKLLALLPAVDNERAQQRHERTAARRAQAAALRSVAAAHSEVAVGEDDVKPTNRRGLLGAGTVGALGAVGMVPAPAAAREVDPELPAHLTRLLNVLGRHEAMFGPRDVLDTVLHQLDIIAAHRQIARGQLRTQLLRLEARWAGLAAWLSEDTGQTHRRDACTARALSLASKADYADMIAYTRTLQSRFAAQQRDAKRAITFAEAGLRIPGTNQQTRALCARQAALGHALSGDTATCERRLADAYGFLDANSPAPPWASADVTHRHIRAGEARCWLWLQPTKAIPLYEDALRQWPRDRARDAGLHQARLALACAAAGEHDRATTEGRKAFAIARTTQSNVAARELKKLGQTLSTAKN